MCVFIYFAASLLYYKMKAVKKKLTIIYEVN